MVKSLVQAAFWTSKAACALNKYHTVLLVTVITPNRVNRHFCHFTGKLDGIAPLMTDLPDGTPPLGKISQSEKFT